MDRIWQAAAEIVKQQASQRVMTPQEIDEMLQQTAHALARIAVTKVEEVGLESFVRSVEPSSKPEPDQPAWVPDITGEESIQDEEIICLECAKSFQMLTSRHLKKHGLTADSYKRKHGIHKDTPLMCKNLLRDKQSNVKLMGEAKSKAKK